MCSCCYDYKRFYFLAKSLNVVDQRLIFVYFCFYFFHREYVISVCKFNKLDGGVWIWVCWWSVVEGKATNMEDIWFKSGIAVTSLISACTQQQSKENRVVWWFIIVGCNVYQVISCSSVGEQEFSYFLYNFIMSFNSQGMDVLFVRNIALHCQFMAPLTPQHHVLIYFRYKGLGDHTYCIRLGYFLITFNVLDKGQKGGRAF